MSPHWSPLLSLLALLFLVNGAPAVLGLLWGGALAPPLDGGRRWRDGHPLFGKAKTWRGLVAALVLTPPAAWALGLGWGLGLAIVLGAMAGDLSASFTKRRLGLKSSASVPVLDQVPETLLPALLVKVPMGLNWLDLELAVTAFTLIDLLATPLFKQLGAGRRA